MYTRPPIVNVRVAVGWPNKLGGCMKKLYKFIIVLAILSPVGALGWHAAGANMPNQVAEVMLVR